MRSLSPLGLALALTACGDATERDADGSTSGDASELDDAAGNDDAATRSRDAGPAERRDARVPGEPPPYDAGPPIEQPCADGIVRATVLTPSRADADHYPFPVIEGDGAFVMMADLDEDGPCPDPSRCGGIVYGRLTRADARTGELLWTTVVELPLTVHGNPPMTIGIRDLGDDGWEVLWAQTRGGWLGAVVHFAEDGTAAEPQPIEDPRGYTPIDLRARVSDPGGFVMTARASSEELLLIRVASGSSSAVVLDLASAGSIWGGGVGQSELARLSDGRVLGLFREPDEGGRIVATIIDPADIEAPRPTATLDAIDPSTLYFLRAVATAEGAVVGATRPTGAAEEAVALDLFWLDPDLRATGSGTLDHPGGAWLLGVSGELPAQAIGVLRTATRGPASLALAIANAPGALVGGVRSVGTMPDRPDVQSSMMWSSEPGVHHVAYWQGSLEVWTFDCGDGS